MRSFWVGGECAGGVDEVLGDLRMCWDREEVLGDLRLCWDQEEVLGERWRSSEEQCSVEECSVQKCSLEDCSVEEGSVERCLRMGGGAVGSWKYWFSALWRSALWRSSLLSCVLWKSDTVEVLSGVE